jgi:metal-dependent hydrolase (beta-lactamase superfamily II)
MVNIVPLYSSSSGNVFYIETSKTNILIDAGVTYKAINDEIKALGY